MACYDNLVTVRGLCDTSTNSLFYLDDLGISLKGAAAAADERNVTGRQLIERKIAQAWEEVYSDISFQGYKAGSIVWGGTIGENTDEYEATGGGWKGLNFEIDDHCPLSQAFLHKVTVCFQAASPSATVSVRLIDGSTTTTLYSGEQTGTSKEILVNQFVENQDFQIQVNTTDLAVCAGAVSTADCDNCYSNWLTITGDDSKNWGLVAEISLLCRPNRYLCKYNGILAKPVWYKAAALVYKEFIMSTRLNDYLTIKAGIENKETITQMAWLDSTMNLYNFDPEGKKDYPEGKYQMEMKKINVPLPGCKCCIECRGSSYQITIP